MRLGALSLDPHWLLVGAAEVRGARRLRAITLHEEVVEG